MPGYGHAAGTEGLSHNSAGETSCATQSIATYLPGRIKTASRHPMLAAVKLWASAHLLVNGTLADVLLFGSFLAWAVAVRISLKRRVPAPVPGAPPSRYNDLIVLLAGLGLYALFIWRLHALIIGVPLLHR